MTDVTETGTGQSSSWPINRIALAVGGVIIGAIVLIFVIGVGLALLTNVDQTGPRVEVIRDIFIIVLAFQGILVVGALVILILQIARLIALLQNEVMPILKNTQDTVKSAKGTVEFVGQNLTEPVIRLNGFLAGSGILLRELLGIRRAVRHDKLTGKENGTSDA